MIGDRISSINLENWQAYAQSNIEIDGNVEFLRHAIGLPKADMNTAKKQLTDTDRREFKAGTGRSSASTPASRRANERPDT